MLNRHSPPISTPLEPCRIAPYVNVASIRSVGNTSGHNVGFKHIHSTTSSGVENKNELISSSMPLLRAATGNSSISAFDPAIISAAHKV